MEQEIKSNRVLGPQTRRVLKSIGSINRKLTAAARETQTAAKNAEKTTEPMQNFTDAVTTLYGGRYK